MDRKVVSVKKKSKERSQTVVTSKFLHINRDIRILKNLQEVKRILFRVLELFQILREILDSRGNKWTENKVKLCERKDQVM